LIPDASALSAIGIVCMPLEPAPAVKERSRERRELTFIKEGKGDATASSQIHGLQEGDSASL
jgi:uncharacterized cupin superfamily protein